MIATLGLLLQVQGAMSPPHGTVVADTMWSQSLGARKEVMVYLPPSYAQGGGRRYPVAYYLHGLAGTQRNWSEQGGVGTVMDSLVAAGHPEFIVVMPDGDDSWYATFNTLQDAAACRRVIPRWVRDTANYCVPWTHYDDYIAHDVVQFVDGKYRTRNDRARRAIGGLSMGGYGSVVLALQYPETFSAAASHSGVLGPLEFAPPEFAVKYQRQMSDSAWRGMRNFVYPSMRIAFGPDSAGWYARDPLHLIDRARARGRAVPPVFADIGTEDPLLGENRAFRDALKARGVPLVYHEWPGAHNFAFWRAHVGESLAWIGEQIAR